MKPLHSLLLAVTVLIPAATAAQLDVQQAVVDGEPVTLFSDGTWRFDTLAAPGSCHPVAVDISFCGDRSILTRTPSSNPEAQGEYSENDRVFGAFLAEGTGIQDAPSMAKNRRVIPENAAGFLDVQPDDIPLLAVYELALGDRVLETIVHERALDGIEFAYANSILLDDIFSAQLLTWSIGSGFGDEHHSAHADDVASFEIRE